METISWEKENVIIIIRRNSANTTFFPITNYDYRIIKLLIRVMVFNATFDNISDISRQSVLLVEETGIP